VVGSNRECGRESLCTDDINPSAIGVLYKMNAPDDALADFDEKIGIWAFHKWKESQRRSKNRAKGEIEVKRQHKLTLRCIRCCLVYSKLSLIKFLICAIPVNTFLSSTMGPP
jgi:hypothetical protein